MLVFHAATYTDLRWGPGVSLRELGPWLQHLNVGVSVFFVLSGFLLFRPFVDAHLAGLVGPAVRPYLLRRLVRIYPAYWVALVGLAVVLDVDLGGWWAQVRYFLLLHVYSGETVLGGMPQAWSLATEVSFYVFLPLWAALLARTGGPAERRRRAHLVGCAALWLLGIGFRAQLRAGDHAVGYAWLPANIDLFALGMALAVWSVAVARGHLPVGRWAETLGRSPGAAWLAAGCCYAGAVALGYPAGFEPPTVAQEVLRQVLFGLMAVLLVAPAVVAPEGPSVLLRGLRSRPLVALGTISYGSYLWHLTVLGDLAGRASGRTSSLVPFVLLGLALTTAVAAVSWGLLERPLLRWAHRRTRGPGGAGAPPRGFRG